MRLAWFTPVVGDGGVVQYSRWVLEALAGVCEPSLYCDRAPEGFPPGIPVVNFVDPPRVLSELGSFDAIFYNLGDNCPQHARIFDIARAVPGIVVLHNRTLHQFFLDYYARDLSRPDLYAKRMAEHHGMAGLATAHRVLGPWFDPATAHAGKSEVARYTFLEEALRSAVGTVVHSRAHAAHVRARWNGRVLESWLPAPPRSALSQPFGAESGAAGDVFTYLREPGDEGCYALLMYQLAVGKPAIVYRADWTVQIPDEAVVKVAPGDREALRRHLRELAHSAALRGAIGAAGREFAAAHSVHAYARRLLRFAEEAASAAVPDRITSHIGQTLASLGVGSCAPEIDEISREAAALLRLPGP